MTPTIRQNAKDPDAAASGLVRGRERRLALRIIATHCGLYVEKLWSALWPSTGFIGLYLIFSLADVWLFLPGFVQSLALIVTLAASALALRRALARTRWPTRAQALRRMELDSGLANRPLSERDDGLSMAGTDQDAEALWHLHKVRQARAIEAARTAWPKSDLPARDPFALRIMVAMVFVVSLVLAGGNAMNRLALAFQPGFSLTVSSQVHVTAWVDPPDFTGLAPIFLTGNNAPTGRQNRLAVPQNSSLVIRIAEARSTPVLVMSDGETAKIRAHPGDSGLHEIQHRLTRSGDARLKDAGRTLDQWRFAITPDAAPYAAFEDTPVGNAVNALEFSVTLQDDYGIGSAAVSITLDETGRGADHEDGTLDVPLPVPLTGETSIRERMALDLTEHYYAGLDVEAELVVRDLGGQEGRSQRVLFRLPKRDFFDPLALAIIEQRKNLARSPADWAVVMRAMEALTLAPERFFDDLTVYIGLRSAYWQLDRTMPTRLVGAAPTLDLLWDLALHVEDGNLSLAEQELRAIAKALQDALARGAPMDEIQRLLQRYQEALERYLAALAEKSMADASDDLDPPGGAGESISSQDLADLLKAIEDLARTGDAAAAAQLLAQMQQMLENMTVSAQGGMNGAESELAGKIGDLSDLIGKERALMDETLRRSRENADAGDSGSHSDLANEQGGLRGELDSQGMESQGPARDASEAMADAEEALRQGDTRRALHAQRRAVDALRQAAEELARDLQQSMEARGAGGPEAGQLDPLGRREGQSGSGPGDHIKVPEQRDLQRARDILKELHKRASEPGRPDIELDYLERLLKRF